MAKQGAAKKETKSDSPKTIGSVKLDKVNRKILVKYAKQLKCGDDKDTTEALVAALNARFVKLPVNRLADCNDCGGSSDKELESCPYCGAADDDDASESGSDDDKSDDASSEPSNDVATAVVVDEASASIDDDPKLVKKQRKAIGENTAKLAIAGASENTIAQYTETDLNEAVDRVRRMKGDSMVSHWRLGHEIKNIFDKQLWKQRNDEANKPAYKSFNQFILQELGFTVQNAYWLMDVSAKFSEEQVREFGTTKLGYVLTAPKEDRPRLLEAAKAGASLREIRQLASDAKEKSGANDPNAPTRDTGRSKPKKRGARAKPVTKKKTKAGTITVAKILGKVTVDLFKGPWPRNGKPETHAKKLGDAPVGMRVLENGVVEYFTLSTTSSGRMVLRIDTRRED